MAIGYKGLRKRRRRRLLHRPLLSKVRISGAVRQSRAALKPDDGPPTHPDQGIERGWDRADLMAEHEVLRADLCAGVTNAIKPLSGVIQGASRILGVGDQLEVKDPPR